MIAATVSQGRRRSDLLFRYQKVPSLSAWGPTSRQRASLNRADPETTLKTLAATIKGALGSRTADGASE